MAVCKCKMCGGDLAITELDKVVECEYCGTAQTVPSADNEKKMTLFNRANRLRMNSEFDKAAGIYENIVAEFPEEAEAYWGIVLCKYGIEYVDDPATGKKIPTCHRSSFESVMEDDLFEQACENADAIARRVYRDEAKQIEEIRKGILEVSSKEEPYDIFICYKETDENGDRTVDSAIAQDVYDALTEKGYRVFFSRITLEDKLGQEYEPYIFAALNSAKIMLAFGTDYEYFNAVWVKNEWSRFLRLIASGQKKTLIPCYKDIDAYDMPKEFAKLQSQDMGKVGAIQDLLRGIEKILPRKTAEAQPAAPVQVVTANPASATVESLLKRAFMFLEDGNWQSADEYAEKVLDIDPENGEAYLVKAMVALQVRRRPVLAEIADFEYNANTAKALRYGTESLINEINGYIAACRKANEEEAAKQRAEKNRRVLLLSERRKQLLPLQKRIAIGSFFALGLKTDGTVISTKYTGEKRFYYGQCDVSKWKDIVAIAIGGSHSLGLKANGTVVSTKYTGLSMNYYGQCDVSKWKDIVAIETGAEFSLGLKADGTVVAVGLNEHGQCDVSGWTDIVAIAAGSNHSLGLKADGTVVAVGSNQHGQCDVSGWTDIIAISAGPNHTLGLKADGTVVSSEYTGDQRLNLGQCNVSGWTNIVAIAAMGWHSLGLKADGTVVSSEYTGDQTFNYGQCNVSGWADIVAIVTDGWHSLGLKADGTVLAEGKNHIILNEIRSWKLFDNYKTITEECAIAIKRVEEKRISRVTALTKEKKDLETELPTLKGLFKGGRRKEVEARLAEIESELQELQ